MSRTLTRGLFCALLGSSLAMAKVVEVRVLARVAGRVVTDRAVYVDAVLEKPELYRPGARSKDLSAEVRAQGLQRSVTQLMILEENRLVGRESVGDAEAARLLEGFRKRLGKRYATFLGDLELSESELREKLVQKSLVEKILASRIGLATAGESRAAKDGPAPEREDNVRKAIDDWLQQLRGRYRVQYLQDGEASSL